MSSFKKHYQGESASPLAGSRTINATKKHPCHFCRAMLCISAAIAVMRCPSVRLSVTFVDHVKTNKHIFEFFLPYSSHTILVFHTKRGGDIPTGTPNGGVEWRWGIGRYRDSGLIAYYRRLLDVRSAKNIYRRRS